MTIEQAIAALEDTAAKLEAYSNALYPNATYNSSTGSFLQQASSLQCSADYLKKTGIFTEDEKTATIIELQLAYNDLNRKAKVCIG